jgi:hypothetical protein
MLLYPACPHIEVISLANTLHMVEELSSKRAWPATHSPTLSDHGRRQETFIPKTADIGWEWWLLHQV